MIHRTPCLKYRGALCRIASFPCVMAVMLMVTPSVATGELRAGAAQVDITPPVGTPSAGFSDRMGRPMEGVHDPLLATALVIDNGEKMIAFVGVDHLGMNKGMVKAVNEIVHANAVTQECEIYLGSSHTHSGGGAHVKLPAIIAQFIAGPFDQEVYQSYIDGTAQAVLMAAQNLAAARVGIGYGHAPDLHRYRGDWPPFVEPPDDVAVIKVTDSGGAPIAVLFNYAAHPTVLGGNNLLFSADYVGAARDHIATMIGGGVQPVFMNGAEGDVTHAAPSAGDPFERIDLMGAALADEVARIWDATETSDTLRIETRRGECGFKKSELNAIVLNDLEAFVTVPGEMSCMYDADFKRFGGWLGFNHVSILGITNDSQGYIVTPEAWRHFTYEATASSAGMYQGERIERTAHTLLHKLEPEIADAAKGVHNE